jgi:hypothetical protein
MSYCRWSSDNYNCDLYCFEHVDGYYQTYVAGNRVRVWMRLFRWLTDKRLWINDDRSIRISRFKTWNWPHWLTHKPIKHELAGAQFQDISEEAMFLRIHDLHKEGFRVPKKLLNKL